MTSRRHIELNLPDDLRFACNEFAKAKTYVNTAYGHLFDKQINTRPADGGWSVAECLEHLCVTAEHYLPLIDDALESAEANELRKQPPYKRSLLAAWLISQTEKVPPKLKIRSPAAFRPVNQHGAEQIRHRFASFQVRLTEAAKRANGLDLGRIKVPSPVTSLLKIPLGQAFRFIAAHQYRHLWQADQVIKENALDRTQKT